MAGDRYLILINGSVTEKNSVQVSSGPSDAGTLPALNNNGLLDPTTLAPQPLYKGVNYTMTVDDYCVIFTCSSGDLTYQLLPASTSGLETKEIEIKNLSTSSHNLFITPDTIETIEGINDSFVLTPGAGVSIRTNRLDGFTLH